MTDKKGNLAGMKVVAPQHELMIVSEEGIVIRMKSGDISRLGRSTQGVRVMSVADSDRVVAVARMEVNQGQQDTDDPRQAALDLLAAGEKDPGDEAPVDIGGDEQVIDIDGE